MVTRPLLITASALVALAGADHPPGFFVELNDGHMMPTVSLGTCCGSTPQAGLISWLAAGGVGVDSSIDYRDQPEIGQLLHENKIPRNSVYITSKVTAGCGKNLSDCGLDPGVVLASINESLTQFGVDFIDLMLLHRPCQQFSQQCSIDPKLSNCTGPNPIPNPTASNNALWAGMATAQKMGLVKSIGVSNYNSDELAALKGPVPAVNQCEMSIQGYDNITIDYCQKNGIVYESYGAMRGCPFTDTQISAIATNHNVSTAQVCLRWVVQRGAVLASGTGNDPTKAAQYAKENLGIFGFNLTVPEMQILNNMQL